MGPAVSARLHVQTTAQQGGLNARTGVGRFTRKAKAWFIRFLRGFLNACRSQKVWTVVITAEAFPLLVGVGVFLISKKLD